MVSCAPDVVIHMAAQPLVRASYVDPRGTFEVNVDGTLSVLEAIQATPSVRAAVIVTTDKVYRNVEKLAGYTETDALGGRDPYSASKAMADIMTSSWANSFPGCSIGIARGGNVIGGGDVAQDRLLPDLIRAFEAGRPANLRAPDSVRPWQHVLDCLCGYLQLARHLLEHDGEGQAWNFGPDASAFRTVGEVATLAASLWGGQASWIPAPNDGPKEAALLTLDATLAHKELGWTGQLDFSESVEWTIEWAKARRHGLGAFEITTSQIKEYMSRLGPASLLKAAQ